MILWGHLHSYHWSRLSEVVIDIWVKRRKKISDAIGNLNLPQLPAPRENYTVYILCVEAV